MNASKPVLQVSGIAFAVYHITDVGRARKFYGEDSSG